MYEGGLQTSVYDCVLAFYVSLDLFFSPSSRQLLMQLIYGTPAECVCVCVHLCGSYCVVTLRLTVERLMKECGSL